jgi:hypothetical protein
VPALNDALTTTPEWLPGCPLSIEAHFAEHYLK